jgi:putative ABC transport system permease protein
MGTLVRDVRYALVTMRRNPWFTSAALATLALGIGATTLIFTVVYGLLIRPLPFPDSDRLVRLWEEHPGGTAIAGQRWLSNRTYEAWTASSTSIEQIGAYRSGEFTVHFGDQTQRMVGSDVSPVVFTLLGATPTLGRFFTSDDLDARIVVVISDRLWRERFGGSPDVLGQRLIVGEDAYTIIGVMRPGWRFPDRSVQFWTPYVIPTLAAEPVRTAVFTAIGRLKAGVSLAQAEAEGTSAARSMPRPMSTNLTFGKGGAVVVHAAPFADDLAAPVRPAAIVMAAAVGCLLLMACANVANLLLSRGVARERELAVRFAIGGTGRRIARQLLTESLVLSIVGGALGVLLAWWLLQLLPVVAPARLPRVDEMQLDWRVLLFAIAATLVCALTAGLAPALRGSRMDLAQAFRGGDGSSGSGFRSRSARGARDLLLVAESAIAVMLLVGAVLLARSFVQLTLVDAGYNPERVLVAQVQLPRQSPPERATQVMDQLLPRLRATPGVVAAGAGTMMPMYSMTAMTTFAISGTFGAPDAQIARARTYVVTSGYAEALGLTLKAGRLFSEGDVQAAARPMIVNEEFARQYLQNQPAIVGFAFGDPSKTDLGTRTEIVGLVANVLKDGNDSPPQPEVFIQSGWPAHAPYQRIVQYINLVVRTTGAPAAMAPVVRTLVRDADAAAIIDRVEPLAPMVAASMAQPRFAARTIGAFALVALLLAAVGLFGVLSYTVAERRRELGIRAAVGAHRGQLIALVMREGLLVTAIGIGVGLLGAAALTRFMQSVLFGVTPLDPWSFAAGPLLLIPIAALACLGPALRAASADPATVLRSS